MPTFGLPLATRAPDEPVAMMRKGLRLAMAGVGWAIVALGVVAFLLFLHTLGILLAAIGLILVLRHSFTARRTFIRAQRRHPKIVFPIRRLIRREPEVMPVAWQASLRFERMITPSRLRGFRVLRRIRRRWMRRSR
jgi:hypothetical protein